MKKNYSKETFYFLRKASIDEFKILNTGLETHRSPPRPINFCQETVTGYLCSLIGCW